MSWAVFNGSRGAVPASQAGKGDMDTSSVVLNALTILLGVPGNSLVIWVAGFRLQPGVLNVWLVNLAVADLIFCLTRVFPLVKKLFLNHWPLGPSVCKFNGLFKYGNMFCSVFFLAVIGLDRAVCVWLPVWARRRRTPRLARAAAACVWAASLVLSAPYFFYRRVRSDGGNLSRCSTDEVRDPGVRTALYWIRFLCGFLLPFLVILCCYALTAAGICRARFSGKPRVLRVSLLLVVAFFACWAPYHGLLMLRMSHGKSPAVKTWLPAAKAVAYFNSCVNPLLYCLAGLLTKGRAGESPAGLCKSALAVVDDVDVEARTGRSGDHPRGSRSSL
ncbi:C3a anaphylatoxin chemotactic receptor-like [Stigmatopora nigra]